MKLVSSKKKTTAKTAGKTTGKAGKSGKPKLVAKKKAQGKAARKSRGLTGKRPKLTGKRSKLTAKRATLTAKRGKGKKKGLLGLVKKDTRGGAREGSGRFSIFRPKVRGRAYPVQDNSHGWKLFDRLTKQTKLSGSDVFTLGLRLLVREYGETLSKESAIALGKRLDEATAA